MNVSKEQLKQVELANVKDDGTEVQTKTRSDAFMLGAMGTYPGHTAMIQLEGMSAHRIR